MGRLDGKVAIVTGAARGQGEAEARLFVSEGARVLLVDVLDDLGQVVADELGEAAVYRHLDVRDEQGWQDTVSAAVEHFGKLDVLLNNAAVVLFQSIEDTTLEEYRRVIEINQIGTFLGMRTALPALKANGGGSIVNVSSIDGIQSKNGLVAYTSSKFAIRGMTKTAALEFGQFGIRVNSIHPGGVDTPMGNPMGDDSINEVYKDFPIARVGKPIDIAYMALFLASDEAAYCTGAEFVVDGGWLCGERTALLPGY